MRWLTPLVVACALAAPTAGCVASAHERTSAPSETAAAPAAIAIQPTELPTIVREAPEPEPPPSLPTGRAELELPAGRSRATVSVTPGFLVSIVVFGEPDALRHFEVMGAPFPEALLEDHRLPRVASFLAPADVTAVDVDLEVKSPVTLTRVELDPAQAAPTDRRSPPPPMIGLPAPESRDAGYLLGSAARYQFARVDVVFALREALAATRARFRRDPIAVYDVSQWNGVRPASDVGQPRHISHAGGRDVDLALPTTDGQPSTMRHHCEGVLEQGGRSFRCVPDTSRGLDSTRLAYLLGKLVKTHKVEAIFLDRVFAAEVAIAADKLAASHALDAGTAKLLGEGGLIRHAGWHTDHVHVRFAGKGAAARF